MNGKEAVFQAIAAGASIEDIERETTLQRKAKGSVPQRNMIRALSSCPRLNDRDDWVRLAAALRC